MANADKIYGKFLPETIDPPARVCFIMEMPDTLQYRAAVMGQINWLADWRCWEHTEADYPDPPARNLEAAALWAQANTVARFEECPVDCEKIIECIETDSDVQEAFNQWFLNQIAGNTAIQQALAQQFMPPVPGEPVPDWYIQKNAAGNNPTCDLDKAWGNIRNGLVDRSFQRVIDVLEKIELTTDNQEMLASALNAMPVLGAVFDVIPITDMALWFDNVRAWMKDAFVAGDTDTLRDGIACDLFCLYQEDCTLSVQSIRDYFWNKATQLIPLWATAFESLANLMAALAQSTVAFGDAIVYALVGSQFGFMTFINDWFGIQMDCIFGDMKLGDPSDDWMALCPDCPEFWDYAFPDGDDWAEFTLLPFAGATCVVDDHKIKAVEDVPPTNNMYSQFEIEVTGNVTKIELDFTTDVDVDATYEYRLYIDDVLAEAVTFADDDDYMLVWEGTMTGTHTYRFLTGARGTPADGNYIWTTAIRWQGEGSNPFI